MSNVKPSVSQDWDAPTLDQKHLRELQESGISEAIARLNFQSLSGQTAVEAVAGPKLNKAQGHGQQFVTKPVSMTLERYQHCESGGWWCHGLDPLNHWQPMEWGCFKPDRPRIDPDKNKPIKYEHPPTEGTRVFFLKTEDLDYWRNVEGDRSIPLIITEGAKKSACGLSHGYATVAVPGVWQVTDKRQDGTHSLRKDLERIVQGRTVFIAFDQDTKAKTRNDVKAATKRAATALMKAGAAQVKVINWSHTQGKGMDDFIMNQGGEKFETAIAKAETIELEEDHDQDGELSALLGGEGDNCPELFSESITTPLKALAKRQRGLYQHFASYR